MTPGLPLPRSIGRPVLVGLATERCGFTSACMAGDLVFTTFAVSDASATLERPGQDR